MLPHSLKTPLPVAYYIYYIFIDVGNTFHLSMKCISNLYGDKRDRTADPLLARQVLSQLSYIPFLNIFLHNSALIALFLSHLHLGKLLAELRQAALIYTKILFNLFKITSIISFSSYLATCVTAISFIKHHSPACFSFSSRFGREKQSSHKPLA